MTDRVAGLGAGWMGRLMVRLEQAFVFPKGRGGRLVRPRFPRVIAGVCSGLAEQYGWDVRVLRFVVVVLTMASSGLLLLGYLLAWVLIPEGARALPGATAS